MLQGGHSLSIPSVTEPEAADVSRWTLGTHGGERACTPAAFVIDSFIMEPPMSLHPTFSSCAARSGPIFTQLACGTHAQPAEAQAEQVRYSCCCCSYW
jgi:hypothetical protein